MKRYSALGISIRAVLVMALALMSIAALAEDDRVQVTGTVKYPNGQPAAGVKIVFCNNQEKATTDETGHYSVELKKGDSFAIGEIGDYVLRGESIDVPSDAISPITRDFTLMRACIVFGEVVDASTGQPIADAQAGAYGAYGTDAKSGADGTFRLRVPPIQGLNIQAAKEGYVTQHFDFSAEGMQTMAFRLSLKPGGVVRGRVVDENGAPANRARVDLDQNNASSRATRTDTDGRYEFRDVDTETPVEIRFTALDGGGYVKPTVANFAQGSKELIVDGVVTTVQLRTITGRVTDDNGRPIADAQVEYGTSTYDWNSRKKARTDADGSYRLEKLPTDKNAICAIAKGFAPKVILVDDVVTNVDVTLGKGHTADIKVVDGQGKPVPKAAISLGLNVAGLGKWRDPEVIGSDTYYYLNIYDRYEWTLTDENGKAHLTDLPEQGIIALIREENHSTAAQDIPIRVGSGENLIVMRGKSVMAGKIVDAASGKPVIGATVRWGSNYTSSSIFEQPDGTFRITLEHGAAPGYDIPVKILANGYYAEEGTVKPTEAPATDYSKVFKLRKAGPIKGKLTDESGKGVAGVKVTIIEKGRMEQNVPPRAEAGAYTVNTTTGANGSFSFDCAPERYAIFIAEKDGYGTIIRRNADLTKPINLVLYRPGVLVVKAVTFVGKGRGSAALRKPDESPDRIQNCVDLSENGIAEYPNLEPGTYRVLTFGSGGQIYRTVTLKPGQKTVLDMDILLPVVIRGRVTKGGEPVPGVSVVVPSSGDHDICRTNAQGEYILSRNEPGKTRLSFNMPNKGAAVGKDVTLQLGENVVNAEMPNAKLSGRVINGATGKPLPGALIVAYRKRFWESDRKYYGYDPGVNHWTDGPGRATTAEDGSFTLDALPTGEVILTLASDLQTSDMTFGPMTVDESKPVSDLVLTLEQSGCIDASAVDLATREPLKSCLFTAMCENGLVIPDGFTGPTSIAPGKYTVWVEPQDRRHLPAKTQVEIVSGKTAKVAFKLPAKPRIIFNVPKDSEFAKLKWMPLYSGGYINPTLNKNIAWIGCALTDTATGKPGIITRTGPQDTCYLECRKPGDALAIPVEPGTYMLDAVLRNNDDRSLDGKDNLWHLTRKVTVKPGQDTVITVK